MTKPYNTMYQKSLREEALVIPKSTFLGGNVKDHDSSWEVIIG